MGLIKKILFMFIPIATLLIAVSYGISIILSTQGVTYLTKNSTGMTIFDFNAYFQNLNFNNIEQPFKNLANSTTIIINPIKAIGEIFSRPYQFGDISKSIGNIGITLINTIIFILDFVISILQILLMILGKLMNLFGINTSADIPLFNSFKAITQFTLIPGIPPLV